LISKIQCFHHLKKATATKFLCFNFLAAANPKLSLEKNDAKRERRQEAGSTKSFK
jgi:hypothetical protein